MVRGRRRAAVLVVVLEGCNGQTGATSSGEDDSKPKTCDGAALEYRSVCFHAHGVERRAYNHPLELDGEPGHELVGVDVDQRVVVQRFDGESFVLVGEAKAPRTVGWWPDVVAGEFDEVPGLDLIVSEVGEWAVLYHLDEDGAPTWVGETTFAGEDSDAMRHPVAVGPDASGRWRLVAHYEDGQNFAEPDQLALWEVQGTTLVQIERFDLPTEICELHSCRGGDFDGDGRIDAVCLLEDLCPSDTTDDQVNVVLLARADGSMATAVYPTTTGGGIATDLDGDGITDLVQEGAMNTLGYLLSDGTGGFEPVAWIDLPPAPTLDWDLISAGDLDGDRNAEVIFGDHSHILVLDDVIGAPGVYKAFELKDNSLNFALPMHATVDVNADGIVDLPVYQYGLLVSERQ